MKVHFSQKLGTRLFIYPVLILLGMFAAGVVAFYYSSPLYFLRDFYKQYLAHLSSEKKLSVDTWFEYHRRHIENISKNQVIRDNLVVLGSAPAASGRPDRKTISRVSKEVQLQTSRLLEDMAFSSNCRMLALLSKDGRIISSSQKDLAGEDWSDRPLIKDMAAASKPGTIIGFYNNGNTGSGIVFLTPILDSGDNMTAIVYSVVNINKLASLLRIENNLYRTEKVELIDRDGNLILTKNGIPGKNLRYNLPKDNKENSVRLRDSLFFYVLNLDYAPFRLIATVEEPEVARPFAMLIILFASFAGLLLLLMIVQSAYLAPRLITRPLSRLAHAAKAAAAGDLNADLGKDYTGEILQMKAAFEAVIEEMKAREDALKASVKSGTQELNPVFYDSISPALKVPLSSIIAGAEAIAGNGSALPEADRKILYDLIGSAKGLASLLDDLLDLSRLEDGTFAVASEEFNACELLQEVERYTRDLIGPREIELIVDCHDAFISKPVFSDRLRLKQILIKLADNAVESTDAGTVTILVSAALRNGIEYIELSVADTGCGFEREALERLFEDYSSSPASPGLILSKRLAEALGGGIEVESEAGKGSVFTVAIPIKAMIY